MQKLLKNRYIYFIKIAITITILYFIFRKIDFKQLLHTFTELRWYVILAIFLTTIVKIYIEYINWGHYLKVNPEYKPKSSEIFKSHMIGHSLRFLLPGGQGVWGKMYFVNNTKRHSFMSMGLERFFQIWINLVFAAFASIFYFRKINITIPIIAFIIVLFFPLFLYWIKNLNLNKSIDVYFKEYGKILPRIAMMQGIYMGVTIFQYFILINNFYDFHIYSAIISIPLILFSNVIPITYAGLGLREKFAIEVLSKYHIANEIAVTVALTVFLFNSVLPALIGTIYIIKNKRMR
jgi:glycosyltransferase 2 family protein